jgi:NAD-dependent SIR2 family protein deacetylase
LKIDVAAISLDIRNFRHPEAQSETEAIEMLLSDEKNHRVAELAEDIVEQGGLDPSSLLIVTKDEKNTGRYISLEGNRRLTALKAMMTPQLASQTPNYEKFKLLHPKFLKLNITSLECVALDREQAAIWIKRKHYNRMGGAGVLQWTAVATARSDASDGKFARWLIALNFLERNGIDGNYFREQIASKTTTVDRVLDSPYITSVLGLIFGKDGSLVPENGNIAATVKLLIELFNAMSDRSFVETKVSKADQQRVFITTFAGLNVKNAVASNLTVTNPAANHPTSNNGSTTSNEGSSKNSTSQPAASTNPTKTAPIPVKTRKVLAIKGLRINSKVLNKFYGELQKLNAENNPHIASAIIRVFLEKSSNYFLETMNIPAPNTKAGSTWYDFDVKLKTKVEAVLKKIDPTGKNPKLEAARDLANGIRDKLHTNDQLNKAIHSHLSLPAHSEIILIWDRFHSYFFELYEAIEKNGKP